MNMQKLNDFFPWNDGCDIENRFIMCYDNNSGSGEFAFVYTLLKMLKDDINIDLICCNHDRGHYESILRKNNLDLNRLESSGRIKLFIVLDQFLPPEQSSSKFIDWNGLRSIYVREVDVSDRSVKRAVFVDDVDALELVAADPSEARQLFSYWTSILNDPEGYIRNVVAFGRLPLETVMQFSSLSDADHSLNRHRPPTNLSTAGSSAHYNYPLDEDQQPSLAEYLRYRADVTVVVSALESGYSSAIHGLVSVTMQSRRLKPQVLQYKALDSGVLCALVGTHRI